jgi:hypothetical protein
MQKKIQLPKEGLRPGDDADQLIDGNDVEGHLIRGIDGDGFEHRTPSSGGEVVATDGDDSLGATHAS